MHVLFFYDDASYGPNPNSHHLLNEAKSIYNQLRHLPGNAIGIWALPGPIAVPAGPLHIEHTSKAFSAAHEWIMNPPATYPAINSLAVGGYICTVHQMWTTGPVYLPLFKA